MGKVIIEVQDKQGTWRRYIECQNNAGTIKHYLQQALKSSSSPNAGKARAVDVDTKAVVDMEFA